MARSSVKIGIIMLAAWIVPLLGIILAVTGLIQAILGYAAGQHEMARAGIFLNSVGLILSLILIAVSVYIYLSGAANLFLNI